MNWLLVFLGGGVGSVARFAMVSGLHRAVGRSFPLGTLAVNLIGCFAIGLVHAHLAARGARPEVRAAIVVGLLGGFTTFSSFGYETFELIRQNRLAAAGAYVLASNAVGVMLVWVGHRAGSAAWG